MEIDLIAGARPNFMKIAPIIDAVKEKQGSGNAISFRLVHTGQHYDANISSNQIILDVVVARPRSFYRA
jgi:UDP-N-acetylglucosamine 2-epimerase (non-hydrolysing)